MPFKHNDKIHSQDALFRFALDTIVVLKVYVSPEPKS